MSIKTRDMSDLVVFEVNGGHVHQSWHKSLPFKLSIEEEEGLVRLAASDDDNIASIDLIMGGTEINGSFLENTLVLCNLPGDDSWFNGRYVVVRTWTAERPYCILQKSPLSLDTMAGSRVILSIRSGSSCGHYRINDLDLAETVVKLVFKEQTTYAVEKVFEYMSEAFELAVQTAATKEPKMSYDDYSITADLSATTSTRRAFVADSFQTPCTMSSAVFDVEDPGWDRDVVVHDTLSILTPEQIYGALLKAGFNTLPAGNVSRLFQLKESNHSLDSLIEFATSYILHFSKSSLVKTLFRHSFTSQLQRRIDEVTLSSASKTRGVVIPNGDPNNSWINHVRSLKSNAEVVDSHEQNDVLCESLKWIPFWRSEMCSRFGVSHWRCLAEAILVSLPDFYIPTWLFRRCVTMPYPTVAQIYDSVVTKGIGTRFPVFLFLCSY